MRYTVSEEVLTLAEDLEFGIIIGKNLTVTRSDERDISALRKAEKELKKTVLPESIREMPSIRACREVMNKAGINPNKYPPSVEAMLRRVAKGAELPSINALVDRCNVISLTHGISLGGHDLKALQEDLEVRLSRPGDRFLPFGESVWEEVAPGELIFTSGRNVQTRKWIWRQSELGKITEDTQNVFFQLAGFHGDPSLKKAAAELEELVHVRFNGDTAVFFVSRSAPSISFSLV